MEIGDREIGKLERQSGREVGDRVREAETLGRYKETEMLGR